MRRLAIAVGCGVVLLGSAGCRGGAERRAAKYVPDGAQIIGGVDIQALVSTDAYKSGTEMDEDAKEALEEFRKCNVDPEKMEAVVVGGNEKGRSVAILVGPGIGDEDNIKCLSDKFNSEFGGDGEIEFEKQDGYQTFKVAAGMYEGVIIDSKTLAISDAGWADDVRELAAGQGTAAINGSLREVYKKANVRKDMWVAAVMPKEAGKELGKAGAAQTVTGWLDYGSGFTAEFTATFEDSEHAEDALDEAQEGLAALRGLAALVEVPPGMLSDVEMETSGSELRVQWAVDQKVLDELAERAGR